MLCCMTHCRLAVHRAELVLLRHMFDEMDAFATSSRPSYIFPTSYSSAGCGGRWRRRTWRQPSHASSSCAQKVAAPTPEQFVSLKFLEVGCRACSAHAMHDARRHRCGSTEYLLHMQHLSPMVVVDDNTRSRLRFCSKQVCRLTAGCRLTSTSNLLHEQTSFERLRLCCIYSGVEVEVVVPPAAASMSVPKAPYSNALNLAAPA